jgi:hypothetical protein
LPTFASDFFPSSHSRGILGATQSF